MTILHSSKAYVFNLQTTSSSEARRLWRRDIKEKWNYECAYCGDKKNLTMDHVLARSKGGTDFTKNVVCCCHSCNQDKGHEPWEEWYFNQDFFSFKRYHNIKEWTQPDPPKDLFMYRPRRNNAS